MPDHPPRKPARKAAAAPPTAQAVLVSVPTATTSSTATTASSKTAAPAPKIAGPTPKVAESTPKVAEPAPHYLGHRQRLREKLSAAPAVLADYELLELLLGQVLPRRDTKPLAKELLTRFGSLRGVITATPEALTEVKGCGEGMAGHWAVLREVFARLGEEPVRQRTVFSGPEVVAQAARARIGHLPVEEFWVALVDNKNRLICWERVGRGTVDQTAVYPREVLALALKHSASGLILAHNHPGGDPAPSTADHDLTRRIKRSAEELGLRVLDHLVVTEGSHFSFQEAGFL